MSETLLLSESFSSSPLLGWTYNASAFSVVAGDLVATVIPKSVQYCVSSDVIPYGSKLRIAWECTVLNSGLSRFSAGDPANYYDFTTDGIGVHETTMVSGSLSQSFAFHVAGGSGIIYQFSYIQVYLVTGKSILINSPPLNSLINKGI